MKIPQSSWARLQPANQWLQNNVSHRSENMHELFESTILTNSTSKRSFKTLSNDVEAFFVCAIRVFVFLVSFQLKVKNWSDWNKGCHAVLLVIFDRKKFWLRSNLAGWPLIRRYFWKSCCPENRYKALRQDHNEKRRIQKTKVKLTASLFSSFKRK